MTEPSLFIRLYLDEDVSVFIAQLLRPHGFEVLTTREAQNLGSSDVTQLQFAAARRYTILTHNRVGVELKGSGVFSVRNPPSPTPRWHSSHSSSVTLSHASPASDVFPGA